MRSRYAAFCEGAVDYLFQTHFSGARSFDDIADIRRSIAGTEWTKLTILATERGQEADTEGTVEFVAACRRRPTLLPSGTGADAEFRQLHERSRFVRENGRWVYLDGDRLPDHRPKRGEPCWCGSGRKARHCHGSTPLRPTKSR